MSFDAPGGAQTVGYDAVILALPFTKLRQAKVSSVSTSRPRS
jgi:hypothetical protein